MFYKDLVMDYYTQEPTYPPTYRVILLLRVYANSQYRA